jgi:hypothetical protein
MVVRMSEIVRSVSETLQTQVNCKGQVELCLRRLAKCSQRYGVEVTVTKVNGDCLTYGRRE